MLTVEDWSYYERCLRQYLTGMGLEIDGKGRLVHPFTPPSDSLERAKAWMLESLIMAGQEWTAEKGDKRVAVRCLLHAREQLGRFGGVYSGMPVAHDCATALQNEIERSVAP